MNFESPSGVYPKQEKPKSSQQEAVEAVRFIIQDLVQEIMREKGLRPEVGAVLQQFEQTLDNSLLFAPVSADGPRLVTALEEVGKLSAWHELVKLGSEAARIRPGSVVIPEQNQGDVSVKRSA